MLDSFENLQHLDRRLARARAVYEPGPGSRETGGAGVDGEGRGGGGPAADAPGDGPVAAASPGLDKSSGFKLGALAVQSFLLAFSDFDDPVYDTAP